MTTLDLEHLVQPDKVHKSVYTDERLFESTAATNPRSKTWATTGRFKSGASPW